MAEERILIQKIEPECKFRELHETTAGGHTWVDFACGKFKKWKGCEEDDFIHCEKKELIGLSRQEAIDKISFALMMEGVDESDCKEVAEAALNALLEGK